MASAPAYRQANQRRADEIGCDLEGLVTTLRDEGADEIFPLELAKAEEVLDRFVAQLTLSKMVKQTRAMVDTELATGSSQPSRRSEEPVFVQIGQDCKDLLSRLPASCPEFAPLTQAFRWLELWRRVPKIYATFRALNAACDAYWELDDPDYGRYDERFHSYQLFLAFCHDLDLGLPCERDDEGIMHCYLSSSEAPHVHVVAPKDGSRQGEYVWLRIKSRRDEDLLSKGVCCAISG